jgi:serine phosphatase RsbU (regulator of sigma subunit)
MTMIGINHLNSIVRENQEENPAKILEKLHKKVVSSLQHSSKKMRDGMDITICKINLESKVLEYASAMSKVLTYSSSLKQAVKHSANRISIGDSNRKVEYTNHTLQFEEGDCLYLSTDGYIDQFGGSRDKKFGSRRLSQLIEEIGHLPMNQQRTKFSESIERWQGSTEQIDDITLIGIRF